MNIDLNNRHVIVTGGAGTLGASTVELFLEAGANVSVPCLNQDEYELFAFKDNPSVFTSTGINLTSEEETQNFFEAAVNQQGPLWASVHTVGGFRMGSIENTDLNGFNRQFQLNTVTCYNSCRAAVQWMRRSSLGGGRIVNVASRPALEARQGKGMTAYTVSKAGVAALTQALAAEVIGDDILVNAVAPSTIDTPENRKAMPKANYDNWPKPHELAAQIVYLCSLQCTVTRGAVIPVYGKS